MDRKTQQVKGSRWVCGGAGIAFCTIWYLAGFSAALVTASIVTSAVLLMGGFGLIMDSLD